MQVTIKTRLMTLKAHKIIMIELFRIDNKKHKLLRTCSHKKPSEIKISKIKFWLILLKVSMMMKRSNISLQ